jgi:hypothetical protein
VTVAIDPDRCEMLWSARDYLDARELPGVATPADLPAIGLTVVAEVGYLRVCRGGGRLWVVGVETPGGGRPARTLAVPG